MKILLATHHLNEYGGTQTQTLVLAKYLQRYGIEVVVYSKYISPELREEFEALQIELCADIKQIVHRNFDLIHVHHNITAYEVRWMFPITPIVLWTHGILPFLEEPPCIDLHISHYLVNNRAGKDHLIQFGIASHDITIIRNLVDDELFCSSIPVSVIPKRALVLSNKISPEREEMLRRVLASQEIECEYLGRRFESVANREIPEYINRADIVFTVGLGAMETMLCGRVPVLFEDNAIPYDDGMVKSSNFDQLKEHNFSGRARQMVLNENDLREHIKMYSSQDAKKIQGMAFQEFAASKKITDFMQVYSKVQNKPKPLPLLPATLRTLKHLVYSVRETQAYTAQPYLPYVTVVEKVHASRYWQFKHHLDYFLGFNPSSSRNSTTMHRLVDN